MKKILDLTNAEELREAFEHISFIELDGKVLYDNLDLFKDDYETKVKSYNSVEEAVEDLKDDLAGASVTLYFPD